LRILTFGLTNTILSLPIKACFYVIKDDRRNDK
jgi:hypothetical protein